MSNFMSNDDALQVFGTYAEDIKKGKGVIAVRETSPATAAHAVGDYIRYNGVTYKVKSAISIGDSLILNTNIEANGLPDGTTIFTPETVGDPTVAFLDDLGDVEISNPQNGQVPTYNSTSGKFENAAVPTVDISGKADKVTSATNGNFAGLDANGNLTDSGKKASDFMADGTVGVAKGGTGQTTLASGEALIGNGTSGVNTRAITNNTARTTTPTGSTNLVTMNSLINGMKNYLNRDTAVDGTDTNYTTKMARAIYATTTDLTPGSTALTSGAIALVYE